MTIDNADFAFTLISVGTIDRKGFSVNMEDGICTVRTPKPERRTIGQIPLANGLYRVSIATNGSPRSDLALAVCRMVKEGTITGIDLDTSLRLNSVPDVLGEKRHRNRFRNFGDLRKPNRATHLLPP